MNSYHQSVPPSSTELGRLDLPQGQRVGVQILVTLALLYAVYTAYAKTDDVMQGMAPSSSHPYDRYDEQPTAVVIGGAFLALICTAYVFITLRDTKMTYLN